MKGREALTEETGLDLVHTGGGCMALGMALSGGREVLATDADGVSLPESADGPWLVGFYNDAGQEITLHEGLDRAGLLAILAEKASLKSDGACPYCRCEDVSDRQGHLRPDGDDRGPWLMVCERCRNEWEVAA